MGAGNRIAAAIEDAERLKRNAKARERRAPRLPCADCGGGGWKENGSGEGYTCRTCLGHGHVTLPTATEVREVLKFVDVGACRIAYHDNWGDERFPWQVRGVANADGDREVLDEFPQYREAVAFARRRSRETFQVEATQEVVLHQTRRVVDGKYVYEAVAGRFLVNWSRRQGARSTWTVTDTQDDRCARADTLEIARETILDMLNRTGG